MIILREKFLSMKRFILLTVILFFSGGTIWAGNSNKLTILEKEGKIKINCLSSEVKSETPGNVFEWAPDPTQEEYKITLNVYSLNKEINTGTLYLRWLPNKLKEVELRDVFINSKFIKLKYRAVFPYFAKLGSISIDRINGKFEIGTLWETHGKISESRFFYRGFCKNLIN